MGEGTEEGLLILMYLCFSILILFKVELHRHLEGAVPFHVLREHYNKFHNTNLSLDEIIKLSSLSKPMSGLKEVLDRLDIFLLAFRDKDSIRNTSRDAVLQAAEENLNKVEFRLSPQYIDETAQVGYDAIMTSIIEGFEEGKKILAERGYEIEVGIILISSRNYGAKFSLETAELAKKWKDHVVGFDFAAEENLFPATDFLSSVEVIKEIGIPLTVHTGEGTSAENIEEVLRLYKPQRLGHATTLIDNVKLMEYCRDNNILVEACPTSNYITKSVKSYETHPLQTYLKFGVPVSINSDDPMLFGTDMNLEWDYVLNKINLTREDLLKMNQYADEHCFIKSKK